MTQPRQIENARPFPALPSAARFQGIGPIEDARLRIERMIQKGEALGVVIGPPGTGKSLLSLKLAASHRQSHTIVSLGELRVSSRHGLIQQVLFHLGKPQQMLDEDSLHLALIETLRSTGDDPRTLLLIIDEAQMLGSDLLDQVRMLTNLVRDGRPWVQTVLLGGPRLDDALVDPQLESLAQRITARCYLHPFNHDETNRYIRDAAAALPITIDDQAIAAVHHASGGIPRLINQLMDRALEFIATRPGQVIDAHVVQAAWSDLQQLPSPVVDADLRPLGHAIEFAELDDDANTAEPDIVSRQVANTVNTVEQRPAESAEPAEVAADTGGFEVGSSESGYADMQAILDATAVESLVFEETATATELFGEGFDEETSIEVCAAGSMSDFVRWPIDDDVAGRSATGDEQDVHDQIRELAATANAALAAGSTETSSTAVQLSDTSFDLPAALAGPLAVVVPSDEESDRIDDRDLLVIEEDLTSAAEPPRRSFVATGGMRQPEQDIDQRFQNLFLRLRGRD